VKRIKAFKLGSHDIKVKYLKAVNDPSSGQSLFGRFDPKTKTIEVALTMHGVDIVEDVIDHTLHHELAHAMMILMYEMDLNQNEKFIDQLGGLMAQFNKTKR
jgi:hypothetical protein